MAGGAWWRRGHLLPHRALRAALPLPPPLLPLLLLLLGLAGRHAAAQQSPASIMAAVAANANLTVLAGALRVAGLDGMLADPGLQATLFAPSDAAFRAAFSYGSLPCTMNYYRTGTCASADQLLRATDLPQLLTNLVVAGNFSLASLSNATRLRMMGDQVKQVTIQRGNQTWLGSAPIAVPNLPAGRGLLHVLSGVPAADARLNESSVAAAAVLGNYGPFNASERAQMVNPTSPSTPTSLASLVGGYQKLRAAVALPQGGLVSPMSIAYNPVSMYRLLRAFPTEGIYDSEAAGDLAAGPAAAAIAPSEWPTTGREIRIGAAGPQGAALPPARPVPEGRVQAASIEQEPGVAESGVQGDLCAPEAAAPWAWALPEGVRRPESNDSLAMMTVLELAALLRSRQVTSVELVQIYTARLKRYDYVLEAVVTYTTDLALQQAAAADALLARGRWLGPLHGVPYGLKDIIAVSGYPTTWGAPQFRNQRIQEDAGVYQKLTAAGAVLVAKLATGEMAYDDVWWGGKTKNPWNIAVGSSGSSAGPAASVAAATVPFSIGSETEGSLMSPSQTCGVTAMRPSLGAIGRSWVMTLADSLDKLGPICRSVADCAVIFDAIRGRDDLDPTSRDAALLDPFSVDVSQLTVGYVAGMDTSAPEVLQVLRDAGARLVPFSLSYQASAEDIIMPVMVAEAAAHFDFWQRSGQDAQNRRQDYWPPLLRLARTIPAVEYIQAQRARSVLALQVLGGMRAAGIDAFIANTTSELAMSNLVGLPTVSVPIGFNRLPGAAGSGRRRTPATVGLFGWPNGEPEVLALGMAWQNATSYHTQAPPIDAVEPAVLAQCTPYSRCTLPPASLAGASAPGISIATQGARAAGAPVADSG